MPDRTERADADASVASRLDPDAAAVAGTLLVSVGAISLMGIVTAEVLYPGYSPVQAISDLGATSPPDSVVHEPSSTIFNATMVSAGALVLAATYFLHRAFEDRLATSVFALFGLGIVGVGVFPASVPPWHALFALVTFAAGGSAAVLSARLVAGPFRYCSVTFGAVALCALGSLLLGDANPLLVLEFGGVERWIVYPILLWGTAFGGYLLGVASARRAVTSSSVG